MTDKGCGCWCRFHSAGKRPAATGDAVWTDLNERGWYTSRQIADRTGMNLSSLVALLDTGHFGKDVGKTRGGHRRCRLRVVERINALTAAEYRLLMGFSDGQRLPERAVPWGETQGTREQRNRERDRLYRAKRRAYIAAMSAETAAHRDDAA